MEEECFGTLKGEKLLSLVLERASKEDCRLAHMMSGPVDISSEERSSFEFQAESDIEKTENDGMMELPLFVQIQDEPNFGSVPWEATVENELETHNSTDEPIMEPCRSLEGDFSSKEMFWNLEKSEYSNDQREHFGSIDFVKRSSDKILRSMGTEKQDDESSGSERTEEELMKAENKSSCLDLRQDNASAQENGDAWNIEIWRSSMLSMSSSNHSRQPQRKGPFRCETCDKCFPGYGLLENHRRVHTGERPFECPLCKKTFAEKSNLAVHKQVHSNDKFFTCSVCMKAFKRSQDLYVHMRLHSGEKPFKCEECSKAFAHQCSFTRHIRTHSGERPFQCMECGKAFAHSGNLTIHIRCHSGERPFSCDDCEKRFSQLSNLYKHKRRMHQAPSVLSSC